MLSYRLVCLPNEVDDEYATLSRTQQIAENQDDVNKNPVVVYKNNRLPRDFTFAGWYEVHSDGEVIPRYDIDTSTGEYIRLAKTHSWHYIAMFKKVESVPYKIVYRFTTRTNGEQSFVVKGEFASAAEIAANTDAAFADLRLSDTFIIGRLPMRAITARPSAGATPIS